MKEGRFESKTAKGRKLTGKMLSFIDAYFGEARFNATKAVQLSQYVTNRPEWHAAELLQHPLIDAEIKRRLAEKTEMTEIRAEYLLQKLMKIIENTEESNPNAALRAIELAGKSIALWRERQEISGPDGAAIQHEQHVKESVEDFNARIAGLAKRNESNVVPLHGTK